MNPFDLTGSTAVVTGGGRGLGLGATQSLLTAGADVVVLSRSPLPDDVQAYADQLGRKVWHERVDLSDRESITRESS